MIYLILLIAIISNWFSYIAWESHLKEVDRVSKIDNKVRILAGFYAFLVGFNSFLLKFVLDLEPTYSLPKYIANVIIFIPHIFFFYFLIRAYDLIYHTVKQVKTYSINIDNDFISSVEFVESSQVDIYKYLIRIVKDMFQKNIEIVATKSERLRQAIDYFPKMLGCMVVNLILFAIITIFL